MCGIAGYIGPRRVADARVEACLGLMGRRGPDASGVYRHEHASGNHLALLHTRLSIIDLDERADQPFRRGPLALAFNGELYNYLEVRRGLAARGERFETASDTEVLAAALATHGPGTAGILDALDECEGMWAFAAYHTDSGELVLCRDRFGEKPLYLHRDGDGLYFGSEVKFLAALAGRSFEPNRRHIERYLVNGYKSLYKTPETFFLGVEEVHAATLLRRTPDGRLDRTRYWTPATLPEEAMTREEAVAGARARLIRSVELRLRSDVPLAFCMSGGVDSNALIAIARRVFDYDVHGFTIVNTDARYDEWDLVRRAVDELGIRHTAIPVDTGGFLPRLKELVRYHDAPVHTITYYAHWLLMEAVAGHGYKVSVSGTAADELFTGYYDHHAMYLAAVHGTPRFESSLAEWNEHIRPIVRNPLLQDPLAFVSNPGQREHIYLDADRFASYLTRGFAEPFAEEEYHPELLRNRMLNELFHEAVPVILHEDDLNAMYYSVENRSPFLDRGLFDHMASVPTRHLIHDGYNKSILREAMRGIVPEPILDERRKVGFNAPIFDFLDRKDPEVRAELTADSPLFDMVRKEAVEGLLERDTLPNSDSKFLFYFLSTKLFLETQAH